MAPPKQSRLLRKDEFAKIYKRDAKAVLYSESGGGPRSAAPNIRSLAWSPLGTTVATSISSNIRVWDPVRPALVKNTVEMRAGGTAMVEKVGFSPTHDSVLASTGGDGTCRLWDVRASPGTGNGTAGKGTQFAECKTGDTGLFLTWHPDGQTVLIGRRDDAVMAVDVRKMSAEDGGWSTEAKDSTPLKDEGQFNTMAFSNSGRELFATTGNGPVKVLDWPSLELLHTLRAHPISTYAVQHSPAGNYVAVGGSDSMITLWDTDNWHCAHTLKPHLGSVRDLSFSFDGQYIAAGNGGDVKDGVSGIEICHADTGEHVYTIETQNPVSWLAWHPQRYCMAYAGDQAGIKIVGWTSNI